MLRFKKYLLLTAIPPLLVLYPLMQSSEKHEYKSKNSSQKFNLPIFSFEALDKRKYNIAEFNTKKILLNFWTTWCNACVKEFPILIEFAKNNPEINLLLISSDDNIIDLTKYIKFFEKKHKIDISLIKNIYIIYDTNKKITFDIFKTQEYPKSIIVLEGLEFTKTVLGSFDNYKEIEEAFAN